MAYMRSRAWKCGLLRQSDPVKKTQWLLFSFINEESQALMVNYSSKAQPLLLTLEEVAPPDLEREVAPLGPPALAQPPLPGHGVAPLSHCPYLGRG